MKRQPEGLVEEAGRLGVALSRDQAEILLAHVAELERWNRRHNLVGPGNPALWLERHTLDSLAAACRVPRGAGIDAGSGAGFPGIPLAVARPDCTVDLVEPRRKRAAFLRHVIARVGLENARVREENVASLGGDRFDFAVSRAAWDLEEWLAVGAPLVRPWGRVIAYVGLEPCREEQLRDAGRAAGLELVEAVRYRAGAQPERSIAVFDRPAAVFHVERSPVA